MESPPPDLPGVEHRFVEANGLRLHVAEAGSGPPLLLLHGWPQHWYEWRHLIGPLARTHRVICPDMRGFGWSEIATEGYDAPNVVADWIALMDRLEIVSASVIGHDWGGWFGWELCLRHPERVEAFLAVATPHPWVRTDLRTLWDLRRFWYQAVNATPVVGPRTIGGVAAYVQGLTRHWSGRAHVWSDEDLAVYAERLRGPARSRASSLLYRGMLTQRLPRAALRPERREIEVPALLLLGEEDRAIAPGWARGIERAGGSARVIVVPGAGHFLPEERPDVVLDHALELFG